MCLAEVSVTEQILREISKFPEILGELSMRKQCVPGSFFSAHAREPGNEAKHRDCLWRRLTTLHTCTYISGIGETSYTHTCT